MVVKKMCYISPILLFFALSSVSCTNAQPNTNRTSGELESDRNNNMVTPSDSSKFVTFLNWFNDDAQFQEEHINDSIEFVVTDYFDEPGSGSTTFIPKEDVMPLLLSAPNTTVTRELVNLSFQFNKDYIIVSLSGQETGFLQEFYFLLLNDNSWVLVKIVDDSV